MIIFTTFFLLGLNYFFLKVIGINLIFFFMRLQSLYFSGLKKEKFWTSISYLLFFPEMITGPHREFNSWNKPRLKIGKLFNIDSLLGLLFYLNLILGSGYIFSLIEGFNNSYPYQTVIVMYTLFLQFWAASRIVNFVSLLFNQEVVRNFNNPFMAKSFSAFWPRWHVSLGNYVKKYITQPLNYLTLKKGYPKFKSYFLSVLVSFLFIALWHKISFSFLLFALITSIILIIERQFLEPLIKRISTFKRFNFLLMLYAQIAFLLSVSPLTNDIRKILITP
tara:strand:+ start:349 stop:1182 length:834 start_codon:yes stop_codon:yes gene_type:complete